MIAPLRFHHRRSPLRPGDRFRRCCRTDACGRCRCARPCRPSGSRDRRVVVGTRFCADRDLIVRIRPRHRAEQRRRRRRPSAPWGPAVSWRVGDRDDARSAEKADCRLDADERSWPAPATRSTRLVSVPTAAAARFAATATADPELEPEGLRSSAYGFRVCPPRALQPLEECDDRKLAHSLRFVLPRMTAPALRSRVTMNASAGGVTPSSASDPAVVIIRSAVAMLSLITIGMPCSGPRGPRPCAFRVELVGDGQRVGVDLDDAAERRALPIERPRCAPDTSRRAIGRCPAQPPSGRCRSAIVASSRSNAGAG